MALTVKVEEFASMALPLLQSKLFVPPTRPALVPRPRLLERLNEGLHRKLTLIAAPAGFGKTTLVSEWVATSKVAQVGSPLGAAAWLSLDARDSDPTRFLTYLIAALQTIAGNIGEEVLRILQSPQPPSAESLLTKLLNEIANVPDNFALILDDYHLLDGQAVDFALSFLLDHLPPQMHLVIATREEPQLPLARLRARGQLTEVRAADLRFTLNEATGFLNQVMGLKLSAEDIAALESRAEGWIAGLQLAAISIQGHTDATRFIKSFTGSHHFILDYLLTEVLHQQSKSVQSFLLHTSILDRLCGPLCDALLRDSSSSSFPAMGTGNEGTQASGQETLEYLERANLFIVPLDNERRWYRYHHLFADLLRQRLYQSVASTGNQKGGIAEYHIRASQWYEANGLAIEAFHHATAAHDIDRAARLMEGDGMPLHVRGAVIPALQWLESLPAAVMDAKPSLWVNYAVRLLAAGQTTGVEEKLQAAEAALYDIDLSDMTQNLVGQIAAVRATLALTRYQIDALIVQSRRALKYLHPNNLASRAKANWTLGFAYYSQGERAAASQAYIEAISLSQAVGDVFTTIMATIGLGSVQEAENQLYLAAETYQRALQLFGEQPLPIASEAQLGLARIDYEWNRLESAQQHAQQSLHLARQFDKVIDRFILSETFLARLKVAQGDVNGASAMLAQAAQAARQQNFVFRIPEVAAMQVLALLRQGNLAAAAHLAQAHELPISQARVYLAQGESATALAVLEPWHQQVEAKALADERLKVILLQALAHQAHGEKEKAIQLLGDALVLAEPGGFIRSFVDEGLPMAQLLSEAVALGMMPEYIGKLLAAFEAEEQKNREQALLPAVPPLQSSVAQQAFAIEPLSQRELEILRLIAQGLSNREICERLFLALDTVKGHNRRIFDKLQVQRRTEAIARARELGLL